ncbi:hypothetical protein [Streptomyces sp. NPDC126514]|uniref:hypothetical protein n=1 Tax=Streptomyces sp. NPDC126514 TaxID=3155210 RepID=UPI00332F272A
MGDEFITNLVTGVCLALFAGTAVFALAGLIRLLVIACRTGRGTRPALHPGTGTGAGAGAGDAVT